MERTGNKFYIYLVTISVNLISFATGNAWTWSSPLIPKFESDDPSINPIGRPLLLSESGLLVSIVNLGLLVGPFLAAAVVGRLGKRYSLLLSGLPLIVSQLMCAFVRDYVAFIIARILMGISTGAVWALMPGYLSEISEPSIRGVLNSLCLITCCMGSLLVYTIGPFMSVKWFSLVNVVPITLFFVLGLWLVPDSPYDLIMRNKTEAARNSLVKLRQSDNVEKEIIEIERIIQSNSKSHAKISDIFENKGSSTALFICSTLMIFNACSGIFIILGYTQTIFDMAGASLKSEYSAIVVGTVAVLASMVNSLLIDRLGRKPIIIGSSFVACLSHASLGIFFHLQANDYNAESLGWLPICSVISFTFAHYLGLGSLPWLILGELFASNIKAVASTICVTMNFLLAFLITLLYPFFIESIGIANTFLFFAAMLAFCFLFCIWKLPETKGKSFEEIFTLLNKKN